MHVVLRVYSCYLIPSQDVQHPYSSPRKWHPILSQLLAEKVSIDFILFHCFLVEVLSLQVRLSGITYVTLLKHLLNLRRGREAERGEADIIVASLSLTFMMR